ncbi:MAG TPA: class I SAM-dependent methyltransferase [Nitrososphaeraceae archaeon]|nr:class I SAM-dependent methyltransferase [Nitrososphaeraceae archaeon]
MIKGIVSDLRCVNNSCNKNRLTLESLREVGDECIEGFLTCNACNSQYPVIQGVPIVLQNFHEYARRRIVIYGKWITNSKSSKLKDFLRSVGMEIHFPTSNDVYEENHLLYRAYSYNQKNYHSDDRLLSLLKRKIEPNHIYKILGKKNLNLSGIGLDIGCSFGSSTFELAKRLPFVFGVDLSFSFILEARKMMHEKVAKNVEFIVSDARNLPFESRFFQSVIALNLVDRIDPHKLIDSINSCIKDNGKLISVDPYHFVNENGNDQSNSFQIRKMVEKSGYKIKSKESYIPWILKMNQRSYLFYLVDFIVAKRII